MSGLLLLREFWRTKRFIVFDESHFCRNKKMMLCIVPQVSFNLFQDSRCLADRRPRRTNGIARDNVICLSLERSHVCFSHLQPHPHLSRPHVHRNVSDPHEEQSGMYALEVLSVMSPLQNIFYLKALYAVSVFNCTSLNSGRIE